MAESKILDDRALDILFREARTYHGWQDREVSGVVLQALYDLMKWGPTSTNCCPARILFLVSRESKERLNSYLSPGNIEQTMTAPVTAVVAYDLKFYEKLPYLSPQNNAKSWFEGKP